MARQVNLNPLNCIQRRDLLASPKATEQQLRAYAWRFLEDKAFYDAAQFFLRIGDTKGLRESLRLAIEHADHDLLWQLAHSGQIEVTEDHWRQCAERALEMEKFRVAACVFQRLGDSEALARLPEDARPKPEQEDN